MGVVSKKFSGASLLSCSLNVSYYLDFPTKFEIAIQPPFFALLDVGTVA